MVSAVPSRSNHTIHPPRSNRITVLLLVWAGFTGIFSPWERVRSLRSTRFEWEISNDHIPGGCWKEWSTESVTTEIVWGCQIGRASCRERVWVACVSVVDED